MAIPPPPTDPKELLDQEDPDTYGSPFGVGDDANLIAQINQDPRDAAERGDVIPPPPGRSSELVSDVVIPPPPPSPQDLVSDDTVPPPPPPDSPLDLVDHSESAGLLQKAARLIEMPGRGFRGIGVGLERAAAAVYHKAKGEPTQSLSDIVTRAAQATEPGYEAQTGEKIGALAGKLAGDLPLYVGLAAVTPTMGAGAVGAGIIQGAVAGGVGNAIGQEAESGNIDKAELAFNVAGGAFLGAAAGKVGAVLQARAARKAANAAFEKLNPLEKAQVLQNESRSAALKQELSAVQSSRDSLLTTGKTEAAAALEQRATDLQQHILDADSYVAAQRGLASMLGKNVASAAEARLAAMTPEQRALHLSELEAAQASGVVKPIPDQSSIEAVGAVIERQARGPIASEQALLGVGDNISIKQAVAAERSIANDAIVALKAGKPITQKARQQAFRAVAEAIENGEFSPETGMSLLGVPDLKTTANRQMAAQVFIEMGSYFGRGLNAISQMAGTMERVLSKDPAAAAIFKQSRAMGKITWPEAPWTPWRAFTDAYRSADNFRRAAMTSGIGTTARNMVTQGARSIGAAVEHALSDTVGVFTGKTKPAAALDSAANDVLGLWHALSPSGRQQIDDLLTKFPIEYEKLLNSPMGEITGGRSLATFLNTLNSVQERFFRRAAFDAWTRTTAGKLGKSVQELGVNEIHEGVKYALDMTYASTPVTTFMQQAEMNAAAKALARSRGVRVADLTPKDLANVAARTRAMFRANNAGSTLLKIYHDIPVLTAIGNPYPKFWLNAMSHLYDLSPLPLFSGETYAAMAHPDARIAFQATSRSLLGMGYLAAGYALAQSNRWGQKWWELNPSGSVDKDGTPNGKMTDMRPFNTEIPPMAIGRLIHDAQKEGSWALLKIPAEDWTQMLLSLKRTDATGIPLLDMVWARSANERSSAMVRTLSNYIGSFVPRALGSSMVNVQGLVDQRARVPRSFNGGILSTAPGTRETFIRRLAVDATNAAYSSVAGQIPFWSNKLSARPSALRPMPEERIDPELRVVGINNRIKTPVETEIDRLGIAQRNLYVKTGNPAFDDLAETELGKLTSMQLERVRTSPGYMKLDNEGKKYVMNYFINRAQTMAIMLATSKEERLKSYYVEYRSRRANVFLKDKLKQKAIQMVIDEQLGVESAGAEAAE